MRPGAILQQFLPLGIGRHSPIAAELHVSDIVLRLKDGLVIPRAILGDDVIFKVAPLPTNIAALVP